MKRVLSIPMDAKNFSSSLKTELDTPDSCPGRHLEDLRVFMSMRTHLDSSEAIARYFLVGELVRELIL